VSQSVLAQRYRAHFVPRRFAPDWRTATFHMRPGIGFRSGDELAADDVVFSFDRIAAHSPIVPARREAR